MAEPEGSTNPTAPRVVIVGYKPHPGKADALLALTREHVPLLRAAGLATDRAAIACRAKDGTILEVFEWAAGALARAHTDPVVLQLWERYAAVCDYLPLNQLPEAADLFADFDPLAL